MSWPAVSIAECARVVGGSTPKSTVPEYWDGDIAWATPRDLAELNSKYIADTPRKITELGLKKCAAEILPENSVLFSSRAPIGHVAINKIPMATNQGFKSIIPGQQLDPSFLYWWLDAHRENLKSLGNGATFKEVSKRVVEQVKIPLPPLEEQKRIAAILDEADALRRLRQSAIDRLNTLGQAIFYEIFGDPLKYTNNSVAYPVGQFADCIVPGRNKPKSFTGSIPWITTSELVPLGYTGSEHSKWGLTEQEIRKVGARIVPKGSVLLTCVGDLGITSIADTDMVINQQLHSYQCSSNIKPEYLMYALSLQKPWMLQRATQTTVTYMNKTNCNSVPIHLPELEKQKRFSDVIAYIEKSKKTHFDHYFKCNCLFDSIQQKAFRGELSGAV
jgi:type I restriction enzyme S subunit